MEALELKGLRTSKGKTQTDIANAIEKSTDSYAKKERGEVLFSPEEMAIVATELEMTFEQFNYIFFGNRLPFGKFFASTSLSGNIIAEERAI